MKKLTALLAVFLCINIVPVQAAQPKTMVLIDNAVDTSIPSINNAISYQVCFSWNGSCPNGKTSMEGVGAATVSTTLFKDSNWNHGTEVASAAIQTDPNIKIIFIRCGSYLLSNNFYTGCNTGDVKNALDWVYTNKDKFNIGAVVSPLGTTVPIGGLTPIPCDMSGVYIPSINKLTAAGLAVIFPTGNQYNYTSIISPACVPGVLAISAIDNVGRLALYANYSSRVDFASEGNLNVLIPGGSTKSDFGTSLSVATFGAKWLKILNAKNLSYTDEYNLIKQTGTSYTNIMVKQNVLAINIAKALQ